MDVKSNKETKRVIRIHPYSTIPEMTGKTPVMSKRLYKIKDCPSRSRGKHRRIGRNNMNFACK